MFDGGFSRKISRDKVAAVFNVVIIVVVLSSNRHEPANRYTSSTTFRPMRVSKPAATISLAENERGSKRPRRKESYIKKKNNTTRNGNDEGILSVHSFQMRGCFG